MNMLQPCGDCGAQAEEPCDPYCVNVTEPYAEESAPVGIEESLGRIMAAIYQLPFGVLAGTPPDRQLMPMEEWAQQLGEYLTTYVEVAHGQVDHLSERATKAMALELQRDMTREYLGVKV